MAITKPVYDKKKAVAASKIGTIASSIASKPTATAAKVGTPIATAKVDTSPVFKEIPKIALTIPKKTKVVVKNIGKVLPKSKGAGKKSSNKPKATNKKAKTSTKKTTNKGYNLAQKTKNAVKTVDQRFKNYLTQYKKNVNMQVRNDTNASNAQYDQSAAAAAQRNAVQKRELQKQLYRNGISGGATETSMMNAANNYATQQGKIASDRVASANTIRQKANADIAAFTLQNMQNQAAALDSAKDRVYNQYQNWLKRHDDLRKERKADKRDNREWKYKVKQDKYNKKQTKKAERNSTYQLQVSGYNSVKTINNLIKKAKKQGKTWKIPYLVARRGEIVRANKNK